MARLNLPYFADPASLPARLPSLEEIESTGHLLSQTAGRRVVSVSEHFVVNYGMQVDLLEGEKMMFIEQQTSHVPVPRVYALFEHSDSDSRATKYIIMQNIKGKPLDIEWPKMDQAAKEAVASQLAKAFEEMRKLDSPGGFCSLDRRALPDDIFWTNDPTQPYAGPFNTENEVNEAMVAKYRSIAAFSDRRADWYARAFRAVLQGHKPVFSHGDFQRKNVMVLDHQDSIGDMTSKPHPGIVIIDWEFAAWYPSYWDYSRATFACGRWRDDWDVWVERILTPAIAEYAWVYMMWIELWS